MTVFTVAWMDVGDRIGLCPRCIPSELARCPAAFDLEPISADEAEGKGCSECGEPLAGVAYDGARIVMEEWVHG